MLWIFLCFTVSLKDASLLFFTYTDYAVILLIVISLFRFANKQYCVYPEDKWESHCLDICLPNQTLQATIQQDCVLLWFPPLHEWFSHIFPQYNFLHMVVSPLGNVAYFLLQMSSLGIYLLNCKGLQIIHISVIKHARNTSQNPIRLVIKKGKSWSLILCRFKSPPWGFLLINYFRFFFFILSVNGTPVQAGLHPPC